MKRTATLLAVGAILVLASYLSWSRIWSAPAPNILLISIDTLSREHVSAYGYSRPTTPTLDRLAAEGALFTDAVSTTNWTLPAQLSALSGLSPAAHRVEDKQDALPDSVRMLAEILRPEGIATAGFVSHIYLDRKYGFARGFDQYDNAPDQPARQVTAKAADWLADHAGERFFLFLHYFDPHWKLQPPREFRRRFAPAGVDLRHGDFRFLFHHLVPGNPMSAAELAEVAGLYDAEVAFVDSSIGLLTDRLRPGGVLDDTIVVIFSDHGEEIGEHGAFGHGTHLHGEVTGVPMIMRYPRRIPRGTVVRAAASITDIPATILTLAGIKVPDQFLEEGAAWFGAAGETKSARDRIRVAESSRWGPKRFAVTRGGYKLMSAALYQPIAFESHADGRVEAFHTAPVAFAEQLFRVRDDPAERADLLALPDRNRKGAEVDRIAAELRRGLRTYLETRNSDPRIVCAEPSGVEAYYDGQVQLTKRLRDDPFGYPPDPGTVIRTLDQTDFRFRLLATAVPAGVVIPLQDPTGSLAIELARNGEQVYAGSVPLPAPGRTTALGSARSGCSLTTPKPKHAPGSEAVVLSQQELDALRSLGYVE